MKPTLAAAVVVLAGIFAAGCGLFTSGTIYSHHSKLYLLIEQDILTFDQDRANREGTLEGLDPSLRTAVYERQGDGSWRLVGHDERARTIRDFGEFERRISASSIRSGPDGTLLIPTRELRPGGADLDRQGGGGH